jgi:hypothetical protein
MAGVKERERISIDLLDIAVPSVKRYFSKHAGENHKDLSGQSHLTLENPVEASGSGNISDVTAAGRKTEEFQIRKFTTKYYRTLLAFFLSQLVIDAM